MIMLVHGGWLTVFFQSYRKKCRGKCWINESSESLFGSAVLNAHVRVCALGYGSGSRKP
jgi:hypothetical protein